MSLKGRTIPCGKAPRNVLTAQRLSQLPEVFALIRPGHYTEYQLCRLTARRRIQPKERIRAKGIPRNPTIFQSGDLQWY